MDKLKPLCVFNCHTLNCVCMCVCVCAGVCVSVYPWVRVCVLHIHLIHSEKGEVCFVILISVEGC